MLEKQEIFLQKDKYSKEIPLSVLFANKAFLATNEDKGSSRVQDFIKLCGIIPAVNMSEEELVENIVKNALFIEFGDIFLKDPNVIDIIKEAVLSDDFLKEKVKVFSEKYCKQKELDKTLIN